MVEHAKGAASETASRDDVRSSPCVHLPEDEIHTRPRIHPTSQHAGSARHDIAKCSNEISTSVRARCVPARAVQMYLDLIGGRRDRADAQPHPADRQRRIAVQRVETLETVEATC